MLNIIYSDIFRLRKGVAIRNSVIGAIAIIMLTACIMYIGDQNMFGLGAEISDSGGISLASYPQNAAEFAMLRIQGDSFLILFILVFIIAIIGLDYSTGTIKNTLAYEPKRRKVYLAKYILTVICALLFTILCVIISWIIGSMFWGVGGFNPVYFTRFSVNLLLMTTLYIGLTGFGYCIVTLSKKSSITIAVYSLSIIILGSITQGIHLLFPTWKWILYLDPISACKIMSQYWLYPASHITIMAFIWLSFGIITSAIGLAKYTAADVI